MDEIEKRLRESTDACIKSFENWIKQSKNLESREELMEAMHDVRKVIARVEIEIAISERDRLGSRPIPIPPHRSQRKRSEGGGEDVDYNSADYDDGNDVQPASNAGEGQQQRRGGGHRHGGRDRRPMRQGGGQGGGGNGNSNSDQQ